MAMMSYTKLILLVASALPAIVAAAATVSKKSCIFDNEAVMKDFHSVEVCFAEIVQEQIGNSSPKHGCRNINEFNTTYENFRRHAVESCIPPEYQNILSERKYHLFELISFSLSDSKFKTDFYNNNGMDCVRNNKKDLVQCAAVATGLTGNIIKMQKYNPKYWLNLNKPEYTDSACDSAEDVKTCVAHVVKDKCNEGVANYLTGIFDHLIDICKASLPQ